MKRRLVSLPIVSCVLVSLCVPALALEATYPESANATEVGSSISVELGGTVSYKNLKVTVPTKIPFLFDPSAELKEKDGIPACMAQVTQPDNLRIVNNSDFEVFVTIQDVKTSGVTLVDTIDDLNNTSCSIFLDIFSTELNSSAMPDYDYTCDLSSTGDILSAASSENKYHIGSYGNIDHNSFAYLYICAAGNSKQWVDKNGYDFQITTTFVVSTMYER